MMRARRPIVARRRRRNFNKNFCFLFGFRETGARRGAAGGVAGGERGMREHDAGQHDAQLHNALRNGRWWRRGNETRGAREWENDK
jgi:hypothetical protein